MENDKIEFVALQDFFDEDLRSHYVAGLGYTVRPGPKGESPSETLLGLKLTEWVEEGKARLSTKEAGVANKARVRGTGKVT